MSRENNINEIPINAVAGDRLQIFVENQGRINYNQIHDFKGILGDVFIDNKPIYGWTITGFPLEDYTAIANVINLSPQPDPGYTSYSSDVRRAPTIFSGQFDITVSPYYDTYLDTTGWGKGIAFVNGFNLGRYWPVAGPQITLYVPKEILTSGTNQIVLIELQKAPNNGTVIFRDTYNLDGYHEY